MSLMMILMPLCDNNSLTKPIWKSLSKRLRRELKESENSISERYKQVSKRETFSYDGKNSLSGIINYLRNKSSGQLENEIEVTASSKISGADDADDPKCTTIFENHEKKSFISDDNPDSWLCFEFKKSCVIPTDYTIRARINYDCCYPRNWVVEASKDNKSWEILDEQKNCTKLDKNNFVQTFKMQNKKSNNSFKYIRIRSCGKNSTNNNCFIINEFELFGKLI